MGYGLAIIAIVLIVGALWYASTIEGPEPTDMSPNTIDSFRVTMSQEGHVVTYLCGEGRLVGNFLWYGNLETQRVTETVHSGKGGGDDQKVTKGYNYYMDIWQGLCLGPDVVLEKLYSNDSIMDPGDYYTISTLNPGDSSYAPPEPGDTAAAMNPVAHIFFKRFFMGFNVSVMPTLHYVVTRIPTNLPLTNVSVGNGVNPAAVIYEILILAGAEVGDFDLTSFQDAADYWYTKGYGISFKATKQEQCKEMINRIFTYVDGVLSVDVENKFYLRAFQDTDTPEATVETKEFTEFQFARQSWDDVYSDFRANFVDRSQDYTERTLRARNTAVARLVGDVKQLGIDLTAFTDVDTASKRLWEIMKKQSYPSATIQCKLPFKYSQYNVGDILRISHTDYGIDAADFRITEKDYSGIDENWIGFKLKQVLEGLFDDNYAEGADPVWSTPTYDPDPVIYQAVFELPYNSTTGRDPAFLVLAQRAGVETAFATMMSPTGVDYVANEILSSWSQRGVLAATYPADTFSIDDEIGIEYTPSYAQDPSFDTISRGDLFYRNRVAVIDSELISFEKVELLGSGNIKLLGCVRGVLNTTIAQHTNGTEIWLTEVSANIITTLPGSSFYLKLLPVFAGSMLDESSASPLAVTVTNKAKTPWAPGRLVAVSDGAGGVTLTIFPSTQEISGAGAEDAALQADQSPFPFNGDFQYYLSSAPSTVVAVSDTTVTLSGVGNITIYVRSRRDGLTSAYVSVAVNGGVAGTYYGPTA